MGNSNISKKPILITSDELSEIGNNMNVISVDKIKSMKSERSFSPRLLNWVEPYEINGISKTLFYTEINSGLKVGDRVFIVNGNYDNDLLIEKDKYKKGRDGYKILFIDRCKIVLDIDYNGVLPYIDDELDSFVKVYNIRTEEEFKHANRQISTRGGTFTNKFDYWKDSIIFVSDDFDPITEWGKTPGLTGAPGFFVRDDSNSSGNGNYSWTNITSDIMSGSFSSAYSGVNNNRLKVLNESFTYDGVEFKENFVYKWEDDKFSNPIITQSLTQSIIDSNFTSNVDGWIASTPGTTLSINSQNELVVNYTPGGGIIQTFSVNTGESYTIDFKSYSPFPGISVKVDGVTLNTNILFTGIHTYSFTASTSNIAVSVDGISGIGGQYKIDYIKIYRNYTVNVPISLKGWYVDVLYHRPMISKSNFRDGDFKGEWNSGIYGRQNKTLNWEGTGVWNNGTLVNSLWKDGIVDSKDGLSQSYLAEFDENGIPYQKVNGVNNNDRGYNYIIDSEFEKSTINSANFIRTTIGKYSGTFSIVENHILSTNHIYNNNVNKAFFEKCNFYDSLVKNSEIKNSRSENTKFDNVKSINSGFKQAVIKDSNYLSDEVIKVLNYDEFALSEYKGTGTYSTIPVSHKVYKFYISRRSYERLKTLDRFYLKNIKINDDKKDVIKFFDKKFRIGSWTEYTDELDSGNKFYKRGVEYSAFLSTPLENEYEYKPMKLNFASSGYTGITNPNINKEYSIDLVVSTYDINGNDINGNGGLDFNSEYSYEIGMFETSKKSKNIIDIRKSYVIDSELESGMFETSNWNSGRHIEYNNDTNITEDNTLGKYYDLSLDIPNSTIIANTSYDSQFQETGKDCLGIGKVVFLNNVDYDTREIQSFTISNIGSGYTQSGVAQTYGSVNGQGFEISYNVANGGINTISVSDSGIGYEVGDILYINGGNGDATIEVLSITGSLVTLPDSYKITSNLGGIVRLEEIHSGTVSVISTLLGGGRFYTDGAYNRYGYISKTKFSKSKIKNGLFRRSYINDSFIEDDSYNIKDKDYNNLEKIRSLVISDSIFRNNGNTLSKGLYMNSSIVKGSDNWVNALGDNIIWNGNTFNNGIIKRSRWIDGTFKDGQFYNSRTFDSISSSIKLDVNTENILSYYKDGNTSNVLRNNRHSWENGSFEGGEFYKSDWENGKFERGKFYYSKWYDGILNNGTIGDKSVEMTDTLFYNGVINYATINGAMLISKDTKHLPSGGKSIQWNDGVFNKGVFGTDTLQSLNTSTWSNGIFNGGQFISNAKWENGIFNGGEFLSGLGWTLAGSTNSLDYGWEDGIFNGGEFGNAKLGTNSTWYSGEFNGGVFKGRWWNDGVFTAGEFQGSSTYSAVGGYNVNGMTTSNAYHFVESYTQSYYGLWNGGYFTNEKDKFIKDKKIFTTIERSTKRIPTKNASINNALWLSGTFSHPSGEFKNSIWLDGGFEAGTFKQSSFNPWVIRPGGVSQSFNTNDDLVTGSGSCVWYNGRFDDSDFYISQWNQGRWLSGTAFGMIWKDGISNYMNAYNIYWENGTWRNGNWEGSNFDFDGCVNPTFNKQIMFRLMDYTGTSSSHVWNVFRSESIDNGSVVVNDANSTVSIRPYIIVM